MSNRSGRFQGIKADYLQTFCEVSRRLSLSDAATVLGLSQPAVSRQLAHLQKHLGYDLYERTSHGVRLTRGGIDLAPYACAVAQTLSQAKNFIEGATPKESVSLTVGLSHHLVTRYTGPLLRAAKRYSQKVGELELNLVEGYSRPLTIQTERYHVDIALVLGEAPLLPTTLDKRRLSEDHVCLLTLPDDPVGAQPYVPFSVIEGETLILPSPESHLHQKIQSALAVLPIRPGKVIRVSGPSAVCTAVMAGQGVGVTLRSFVEPEVQAGWFKCIGIKNSGFAVNIWRLTQAFNKEREAPRQALKTMLNLMSDESQG